MNTCKMIILLLGAVYFSDCKSDTVNKLNISSEAEYIFHIEYQNYAYGFNHKGLFVNNKGEVYFYQLEQSSNFRSDRSYTGNELEEMFSQNKTYLTTIESSEFDHKVDQSLMVELNQLSDPENTCADAGIFRYTAFDYSLLENEYADVLLYQTGDWRVVNSDTDAIQLRDWLIILALEYGIAIDLGHSGYCTGLADNLEAK